ncbi:MAG: mechanosensitive ion channel domain-containing protein [Bacteroidota bacterium]
MKEFTNWTELLFESLKAFGERTMSSIPYILGALLILLLGWLFAKLISAGVTRLLKVIKFDGFSDRVKASEMLKKANITAAPSKLIGKFIYWLLMLLVIMTASDALGWSAVSSEISNLLGYLPQLFVAIVFFVVGLYIAAFVRDIILGTTSSIGISAGKIISTVVYYFLFVIVTLTALDQGGFDTTIITSNLMLIIGAILAAAAISYGFASKDVLSNMLAGYFAKNTFKVGQTIEVEEIEGTIVQQSNIAIKLQTNGGEHIVVPMHKLLTNNVRIKD